MDLFGIMQLSQVKIKNVTNFVFLESVVLATFDEINQTIVSNVFE